MPFLICNRKDPAGQRSARNENPQTRQFHVIRPERFINHD